jgi:hypothetical protein
LPLPADQQQADPVAQPAEVLSGQVPDVIHRVVEVRLFAALAPRVPRGRVVVAGEAQREREQVGPLEREVRRVKGAQAAAERRDLQFTAAIGVDERHDLAENPRLVTAVFASAILQGQALIRPGLAVVAVDAVKLDPAGVEQLRNGIDHAVAGKVRRAALL